MNDLPILLARAAKCAVADGVDHETFVAYADFSFLAFSEVMSEAVHPGTSAEDCGGAEGISQESRFALAQLPRAS